MDRIEINGLEVDCVIGLYPRERHVPQKLRLDLSMGCSTEQAARKETLSASVDYAAIAAQLGFLLRSCEFRLIETAAHALARYLLAPPALGERRAQIDWVGLRLSKPFALGDGALPSLYIERERNWVTIAQEHKPFGVVDIIHETREASIYRLNVAPAAEIPLHVHHVMREAEMVLSEGLLCQRVPVAIGTVHRWPQGAAHTYANPSQRFQTILCVDSPRFIETDEVMVDGEPAQVDPEARELEAGREPNQPRHKLRASDAPHASEPEARQTQVKPEAPSTS
jgi:FolB domain-containing protein